MKVGMGSTLAQVFGAVVKAQKGEGEGKRDGREYAVELVSNALHLVVVRQGECEAQWLKHAKGQ